jgi:hypothetical protein
MSKLGTIDFHGASGKLYTFNVYSYNDNQFKPKGGIFVVTKRTEKENGTGIHKKLFIGQATDLGLAYVNLDREACYEKEGANCFCTYWEDSDELRQQIVEDLVDNYHPPCN